MPSSSRRKRLTVIASAQGVETAEKTLTRLGFGSKEAFRTVKYLSKGSMAKFFHRRPMELETFKEICEGLELDWREILDSESNVEIGQPEGTGQPDVVEMSDTATSQPVGTTLAITRKITVRDTQGSFKTEIVLEGDIESVNDSFKTTLEVVLQRYGGDTIRVTDIKAGSIKITIQGSQQDIERLRERIASGELTQINNCRIENFRILGDESLEVPESSRLETKWEIIQDIKTRPQSDRELRDADLSDADLSGADLSRADLSGADLSGADLSDADLSGANLSEADLSRANLNCVNLMIADLSGADLSDADLSGTTLFGTVLSGANLSGANLSRADLTGTNLSGADLRSTDLSGTNLSRADLSRADLRSTDLSGTNLSRADLSRANLSHANLSDIELSQIDLSLTDLSYANLNGANLSGSELNRANLFGANLNHADLNGANLFGATLLDANLSHANLSEAVVQDARFGEGQGLSQEQKQDLARRGAIFGDASGDRETAYSSR